jgi:hypothetical protein
MTCSGLALMRGRRRMTVPKLKPEEVLYIRSMGKALRVEAICSTVDEANELMNRHPQLAVVACFDNDSRIYLADQYDQGERIG